MTGTKKYDCEKHRTRLPVDSWDDPECDMLQSPTDTGLFGKISAYMKGFLDIEDVKSDPSYNFVNELAIEMVSGYGNDTSLKTDNKRFISESLKDETPDEDLLNEISKIKNEIGKTNLNDISSEWVNEWQEKKSKVSVGGNDTMEIRDFITDSFDRKEEKNTGKSEPGKKKGISKTLIIRHTCLAAAVILGAVLLIKPLLLPDDPQEIFEKYYGPFSVVSSVTRSAVSNESESLTNAIATYKSADYRNAEAGFSEAMLNEKTSVSAGFFLGITELEIGDYPKAIELLEGVRNRHGEFFKEATWYLGLAYIKSGNKIKASECFELLAGSPGFYSDRSEEILRRLK